MENAKDSLVHAVEHLTNPSGVKVCDYKHAISDLAHAVELLLKERLYRIHPSFIWKNIDKYPLSKVYKINTDIAIDRLLRLGNIKLPDHQVNTINACRDIRNDIEHYEFEYDDKEAKAIIGRMLSFIFDFSKRYLNVDLQAEFKKDDTWASLVDIHEFWEAHGQALEKQLIEAKRHISDCVLCGANTYDFDLYHCELCGNTDYEVECEMCNSNVLESQTELIECVDGDPDSGETERSTMIVCKDCLENDSTQDASTDQLKNS